MSTDFKAGDRVVFNGENDKDYWGGGGVRGTFSHSDARYDHIVADVDATYRDGALLLREYRDGATPVGVPAGHLTLETPTVSNAQPSLPEDDATRGQYPMAEGCLDYFPNALAEVSRISYAGNQKHNPGQKMHWARGKSTDHRNKIIRHTVDSVTEDEAGIEHAAQAAWRALAELQEKIERVRGAPMSKASRAGDA